MGNESWTFSPGGAPKQARAAGTSEPAGKAPDIPPPPYASAPAVPQAPQLHSMVYPQQVPIQRLTNGMATASLVLGILGFFLPILSILALIFGGIGISKANQGASGKGLAVAGLVLGILGTLALLVALGEMS